MFDGHLIQMINDKMELLFCVNLTLIFIYLLACLNIFVGLSLSRGDPTGNIRMAAVRVR